MIILIILIILQSSYLLFTPDYNGRHSHGFPANPAEDVAAAPPHSRRSLMDHALPDSAHGTAYVPPNPERPLEAPTRQGRRAAGMMG